MLLKLWTTKLFYHPGPNLLRFKRIRCVCIGVNVGFLQRLSQPPTAETCKPVITYTNVTLNRLCSSEGSLGKIEFESVCAQTLDSLSDYFEELVETIPEFKNGDVSYSDGVLTVNLGKSYGTYVINRQSPNLQIWLSSPVSGPKRYDFIGGTWVYRHDQTTLHALLDKEIQEIVREKVQFTRKCVYSKSNST